ARGGTVGGAAGVSPLARRALAPPPGLRRARRVLLPGRVLEAERLGLRVGRRLRAAVLPAQHVHRYRALAGREPRAVQGLLVARPRLRALDAARHVPAAAPAGALGGGAVSPPHPVGV